MNHLPLSGQWTLERLPTGETYPAMLPGDNLSALLAARSVPDPYQGKNELQVQWVGREDWAFRRTFLVTEALLSSREVFLDLESVDTVAEYWVNGHRAGSSQSMFVPVRLPVRAFLKAGENDLKVVLR